jgi:hypothetical protein
LCDDRPFASPLPGGAQHVTPIIASIIRIDIVPKDRCRNSTIRHQRTTPLTVVSLLGCQTGNDICEERSTERDAPLPFERLQPYVVNC